MIAVIAVLIFFSSLQPWDGVSSINNIEYPTNIEQLWTAPQLATIGLCKAIQFATPANETAVGSPTYVNNGNGTCSQQFAVQTTPSPSVTPLQYMGVLARNAELATAQNWINNTAGPLVQLYWQRADTISPGDLGFNALINGVGFSFAQEVAYFTEAAIFSRQALQ